MALNFLLNSTPKHARRYLETRERIYKYRSEENSLFDRVKIKKKKSNSNGAKRCRNSISKHGYFLHQRSSDRSALFFFFFFSGIRAGIVLLVEKYHFIRAPCAAINHVYEAYRNFMKSGIESVWAHNDENNKDVASRNLSIRILWTYISSIEICISITIFYHIFSNKNEQKFEFFTNSF